jgi:hypothetical protein
MVAHRPQTLYWVDRVVVIRNGTVEAQGHVNEVKVRDEDLAGAPPAGPGSSPSEGT